MRSLNRPYLPRIDMLRGIAAWWVVLFHCVTLLPSGAATVTPWPGGRNPLPIVAAGGWLAVSLFLVVSGFTIATGLRGHEVLWRWFLAARWLRIAPLYLVILVIGLAVSAPTYPPLAPGDDDMAARIAAAFTMLPFPTAWTPVPWLATGWTIRIEFALYLAVPLITFVLARYRPAAAIAFLVAASALFLAVSIALSDTVREVVYFGVAGRLPEFLGGFLIGYFLPRDSGWTRIRYLPWGAAGVLVAIGAISVFLGGEAALTPQVRIPAWLLTLVACAALAVWGAAPSSTATPAAGLRWRRAVPESLRVLGLWSYSTYLWHYAVIVLVAAPISVRLGERYGLELQPRVAVGILIAVVVTAVISWMSFRVIESPFLRLRHRYVRTAK